MTRLVIAFSLFFTLLCSAQTPDIPNAKEPQLTSVQQTLIAQTQAVAEAQRSKDGDALKRLLTDDFQQVGSEGKLHPKDEFIGDARDGKLKDSMLYSFKVLAVDGNTAIVTYDAVIHGIEGDEVVVPHYQHLSDVWVKQGEQWRLRFQQATARRPID